MYQKKVEWDGVQSDVLTEERLFENFQTKCCADFERFKIAKNAYRRVFKISNIYIIVNVLPIFRTPQ